MRCLSRRAGMMRGCGQREALLKMLNFLIYFIMHLFIYHIFSFPFCIRGENRFHSFLPQERAVAVFLDSISKSNRIRGKRGLGIPRARTHDHYSLPAPSVRYLSFPPHRAPSTVHQQPGPHLKGWWKVEVAGTTIPDITPVPDICKTTES